ncbi:MAG: hypothetical protein MI700_07315 [Balneolales bacterium]|nr:hypothetical protein [Balneolales bacterium]
MNRLKQMFLLALVLSISFTACSSVNNEVNAISDEDLDLAANIVASSVSDDESGMISSIYDAFSDVDNSGISYSDDARFKSHDRRGRSGRGGEIDYTHTYDSTTGIHTLEYTRVVEKEDFSKTVSVYQEAIFTDLNGNFIAEPKANKDSIEAISFTSTKSGSSESLFRSGSFTKSDDFDISGAHETSNILSMDGTHSGSGSASGLTRDTLEASRTYEIDIEYDNVAINKDSVEAHGSLEFAVTGTLTYSVTMSKTIDGVTDETVLEGTINLEEDGTALLEFRGISQIFRFGLGDGEFRNDRD